MLNTLEIIEYNCSHEDLLFNLLEREGEDWSCYYSEPHRINYTRALSSSIVFLLLCENNVCGYIRCRDDDGFGLYVYDLLIDKMHRNKQYGLLLLNHVKLLSKTTPVYVMSGVDPYYEKLGYQKEGTIFTVKE